MAAAEIMLITHAYPFVQDSVNQPDENVHCGKYDYLITDLKTSPVCRFDLTLINPDFKFQIRLTLIAEATMQTVSPSGFLLQFNGLGTQILQNIAKLLPSPHKYNDVLLYGDVAVNCILQRGTWRYAVNLYRDDTLTLKHGSIKQLFELFSKRWNYVVPQMRV